MLKDAVDLTEMSRVLVVKLRHHGDVLLTSPVFSVLKSHAPHLELDALVYHDTREMLTLHPAIANVHTIDRAWKKETPFARLGHEWQLLKQLRARRYDLLIHLTESYRGALLAQWLTPHIRVAQSYERRGRFWHGSFSHTYKIPAKPRHRVELHLDALRRIGIYPGPDERRLTLVPGADAELSVDDLLRQSGLAPRQFIHLHPTSRWFFKTWEVDKYAALIESLQSTGERVVITAAPAEQELQFVRAVLRSVRTPVVDLSGGLSLKQLAALTARAKCFIGVDSVPMHIAAAMGTPTVALFGPSGDLEWGPWKVTSRILTSDHSCRPCGLDGCGQGKFSECMSVISVEQVLTAVRQIA
ncbi:MAG: putative lipopolysaccharide heptosyltransferase III [Gammaproteobacteria bacterium]|nr:putative lipopolysaccharide heptosyltransferase III [Gammaproteobacteria bacterium]